MESVLVNLKTPSEEKVLLAFLKSLKIKYEKMNVTKEEKAIVVAVNEGKLSGRVSEKKQEEFENWLNSL